MCRVVILLLVVVTGCAQSNSTERAFFKQQPSVIRGAFDAAGRVARPKEDLRYVAVATKLEVGEFMVSSSELRGSATVVVVVSGTAGHVVGEDIETSTVGRSEFGHYQPEEARYVIVHYTGTDPLIVEITTGPTAGTTLSLPPDRMVEVTYGPGGWVFGPIEPIDHADPAVAAIDAARAKL